MLPAVCLRPTWNTLTVPLRSAGKAPIVSEGLESTLVPAGFRLVNAEEGTIAYSGPFCVRGKLERAGVHLVAMRHGQTVANLAREQGKPAVLSGQSEVALTETGRRQAEEAAQQLCSQLGGEAWLQRAARDPSLLPVVYTSPLSRAALTAEALASLLRERSGGTVELPILPDDRLKEIHFGRYEMKTRDDLRSDYPDFTHRMDSFQGPGNDFVHRFPGGESRLDVVDRVQSFLGDVADRHPGRTVLVVCHMETMVGMRTALGYSRQREGSVRADAQEMKNATPLTLLPREGDLTPCT